MTPTEAAAKELFEEVERIAINGYTRWTGKNWCFSDTVWRRADRRGFAAAANVREALGLSPFKYSGPDYPPYPDRN